MVTAVFRACLTPAVASASEYAHRGLDKLEENLPILQQHTEKVTGARRREPPRGRGLAGCRVWRPPGLGLTLRHPCPVALPHGAVGRMF